MKKIIKKLVKYLGYEIIKSRQPQINLPALLSLFFYKTPRDFFFVQIGANDGKNNDPIYDFVSKYKLSGLLVEPQKNAFKSLCKNYGDNNNLIYENAAISYKDEYQSMYIIKEAFQDTYGELTTTANPSGPSSFDKDHVRKWIRRGGAMTEFFKDKQVDDYIEEIQVKTITFDTLMRKHNIKSIDLLQIDAEGFDFEIIKMIDFDKYPPKLINYESAHLRAKNSRIECESFLQNKGYLLLRNNEDTCAVRIIDHNDR